MWLLDANMDVHFTSVLAEFGIVSETALGRGWKALSNGKLVAAAVASGFDCLLTRDRLLRESASHALRLHSTFAVILVNLPQQRWPEYRERFLKAWASAPIVPKQGCVIEWP
jgi:hypothetical protein